ncbi:MAG: hypothetical protein ACRDTC_11740 [Pseudonocardiaceae bacterium]
MGEGLRSQGFWQTIPGILTGVAAVLTAVGGLLAILFQAGIIGGDGSPAPLPEASAAQSHTTPGGAFNTTTKAAAGKPWEEVEAVFTAKDGTVISGRAETVRYCISAGQGIGLNDTQEIPFEKMTSLEVLRSDDQFAPSGKATVVVTTVSGQTLQGTIGAGCDFFAFNDLGRFSLYPQKLSGIEFRR